jgi:hypothetical protein
VLLEINQTAKRFLNQDSTTISSYSPKRWDTAAQPLLDDDASRIESKRLRNCSEAAGAVYLTAAVPFRKHINKQ